MTLTLAQRDDAGCASALTASLESSRFMTARAVRCRLPNQPTRETDMTSRSTKNPTNVKKAAMALTTALIASSYGCSSAPPPAPAEEPVGTTSEALSGSITFDSSCLTPPSPQTTPPAVPANVMRHLQIGEAYTRIVANSPAFRECMQHV